MNLTTIVKLLWFCFYHNHYPKHMRPQESEIRSSFACCGGAAGDLWLYTG